MRGEEVALKVMNPKRLRSESKRFQFTKELMALDKLRHPNLIQFIECGDEGGEVYYAMELCSGGDLSRLTVSSDASITPPLGMPRALAGARFRST